ncbi:MAG: hypothetical protein CK425_06380 [Parachlamydia sp.]|nr:MAG: hypothetical protein CK425_06380 [Parachlamydia sp.]
MKVIILAAGAGKRLGSENIPKPLTKLINGQSILEFQLERLKPHVSLDDIILVVGYQKEKIMEAFPNVLFVYNPDFAQENTAKSLLRALRKVNEDVLLLNGDVIFHLSVLEQLLTCASSCMLVNKESVGKEEVKYRTDEKHQIVDVSKEIEYAEGEALGINFFSKNDIPLLISCLERCSAKDYFEQAIQWAILAGMKVQAKIVLASQCMEIDFPRDLQRANQMLKLWEEGIST